MNFIAQLQTYGQIQTVMACRACDGGWRCWSGTLNRTAQHFRFQFNDLLPPVPLDVFLVLEPLCFPKDCRVAVSHCTSALPPLDFMCASPRNLTKSFTICGGCLSVYCRIIPSPLPIRNFTSKIRLVPEKDVQQSLQDPTLQGNSFTSPQVTFQNFVFLICITIIVPAEIRDAVKHGNDQVQ